MPQFQKSLDVCQGYNFRKGVQTPVGFLTRLVLGDIELAADQRCVSPTDPTATVQAVAVLTNVLWELGVTDAVYLSGQVSAANQQRLAALLVANLTQLGVTFRCVVHAYDPISRAYYPALHSGSVDLAGLLEKSGDDLNLSVADDPGTEVQSPANFTFQIGVKPAAIPQTLHLAVDSGRTFPKPWGLRGA